MAGTSRSLTLKLIADIDSFTKGLNQADNQTKTFSDKVTDFGKKAGLAFAAAAAAAAAYAGKLAIDGVKAAIEDEAAQIRLANALKSATGATNEQIAATEKQILQTSLMTGVSDDQLRPALSRLAISTGSVTDAQKLLNLSLDVAQATGRPLEATTAAIAKAYDGNTAALGKLGIGLSSAELKTMSFQDVQQRLTDLFGGAAAANADTFQGKIARLSVAFDEAKETVGFALLPILQAVIDYILGTVIPAIGKFASIFDPVKKAIMDNKDSFMALFNFLKDTIVPFILGNMVNAFKTIANIAAGVINVIGTVIEKMTPLINTAINGINMLIRAYNAIPFLNDVGYIPAFGGASASSVGASFASSINALGGGGGSGLTTGSAGGGAGAKGSTAKSKATAANAPTVYAGGALAGGGFLTGAAAAAALKAAQDLNTWAQERGQTLNTSGMVGGITINVSGALDAESTARQIVDVLNTSVASGSSIGSLNPSLVGSG
jgi:hypothetical protein